MTEKCVLVLEYIVQILQGGTITQNMLRDEDELWFLLQIS